MLQHRLGRSLFFLSFLSLTQCNLNEVLTSLFIGSSVVSTAATIAGAVANNNLVTDESAVSLNENAEPGLAILNQDELHCELLIEGDMAADSEGIQVDVWRERDGSERTSVEVLSVASLVDLPDVQFSLYLLTDALAEEASEAEAELGEVFRVSHTSLWVQNLVEVLEAHDDDSHPVLIINAAAQILLTDEDRQQLLDSAWQKKAFFMLDNQNASGPLAQVLAADRRLLETLADEAIDADSVFEEVASLIGSTFLVSVPASACESGEHLLGEVLAE